MARPPLRLSCTECGGEVQSTRTSWVSMCWMVAGCHLGHTGCWVCLARCAHSFWGTQTDQSAAWLTRFRALRWLVPVKVLSFQSTVIKHKQKPFKAIARGPVSRQKGPEDLQGPCEWGGSSATLFLYGLSVGSVLCWAPKPLASLSSQIPSELIKNSTT